MYTISVGLFRSLTLSEVSGRKSDLFGTLNATLLKCYMGNNRQKIERKTEIYL